MVSRGLILFGAQILLIKTVLSQCTCSNAILSNDSPVITTLPSGTGPCGPTLSLNINSLLSQQLLESLSRGGPLSVSSGSSVSPNGLQVSADNLVMDGNVEVAGNIPLLGAVALDGNMPSGGQAAVTYNAGNGAAITSAGCGGGLAGSIGYNGLNGLNNLNGLNSLNGLSLGNVRSAGCGL